MASSHGKFTWQVHVASSHGKFKRPTTLPAGLRRQFDAIGTSLLDCLHRRARLFNALSYCQGESPSSLSLAEVANSSNVRVFPMLSS